LLTVYFANFTVGNVIDASDCPNIHSRSRVQSVLMAIFSSGHRDELGDNELLTAFGESSGHFFTHQWRQRK
jgi:hypothetical protein